MQFLQGYILYFDSMYSKPNKAPVQLCNPENMLGLKRDETTINKRGKKTQHLAAALKWEPDQIPVRSKLPVFPTD